MSDIVLALGLVLVLEGALYAFAPEQLKRLMAGLQGAPADVLRTGGLLAVGVGLLIVWMARGFLAAS